MRLDGEGGGAWDLKVRRGQLLVEPIGSEELAVTVHLSVQDWRATLFPEAGTFALRPPRGSPLDILFVDPQLRALIDQLRGLLRLEVDGYNGRTWALQLKFGKHAAPDAPDAVVTMTAETYRKLKDKTLLPPQAYFAGLVNMTGNTGLAMQMAMAILPRFTG